ncbi:MAG: FGGY-family carbohydrate kinase [Alkalibacterium sp.]|nr:FGGY-family carbohydrate kinase [Alkalibacterium sp.]
MQFYEGITFSLGGSFELMKKHSNKDFKQIVSVGGGAKNPDWLRMRADVLRHTCRHPGNRAGTCNERSAMIRAVGAGW